jgi:hypothetical protein
MQRRTLLKYLVAASAGAALERGVAFAQMPERVVAMCGGGSVAWESLCNVDAGLHEAFRWIERIGGSEELLVRNRLSAMIRDRHVAIDWHPNQDLPAIHPGLLGLFDKTSGRVYVPQALRSQPERVKAAILAHELTHAAWQVDQTGAELDAPSACLVDEARAYQVGLVLYARIFTLSGEGDGPRTALDQSLMAQVGELTALARERGSIAEGLNEMARRHLARSGYVQACARLGGGPAPQGDPGPEAPGGGDPGGDGGDEEGPDDEAE